MKKGDIWFMSYSAKEIGRNFLSVAAGVLICISSGWGLTYLCEVLFPIGRHLGTFDKIIILFLLIFLPAMMGGVVTTYVSTKNDFIHALLTALIFIIVVYVVMNDVNDFTDLNILSNEGIKLLMIFLLIILSAMAGGYTGIYLKKKKTVR